MSATPISGTVVRSGTVGGTITGSGIIGGSFPKIGQLSGMIQVELNERVGNAIVGIAIVREE